MITSVCIFLLDWGKILVGMLLVFLVGSTLFGKSLVPLSFNLGEDYRLDEPMQRTLELEYLGKEYNDIGIWPTSYYLDLDQLPVSDYYTIIPMCLIVGGFYYLLHLLVRLLKSIEQKEFFSLLNVRRLRIMGFLIITYSILSWLYSHLIKYMLIDYLEIDGLVHVGSRLSFNLSFLNLPFFLGLITLLVANAFEHGLKLKEEQELTI